MWYTINVSGAKICQLDPVEARNMNILTCSPNIFITAAPPPRRSHAPHPCRGSLASRPGGLSYRKSRPGGLSYGETPRPRWCADDAAAPEIRITPPSTNVNLFHSSLHAQTNRTPSWTTLSQKSPQGAICVAPHTLLDNAPAKEPPRGYSRCTKMTMTAWLQIAPPGAVSVPEVIRRNVS